MYLFLITFWRNRSKSASDHFWIYCWKDWYEKNHNQVAEWGACFIGDYCFAEATFASTDVKFPWTGNLKVPRLFSSPGLSGAIIPQRIECYHRFRKRLFGCHSQSCLRHLSNRICWHQFSNSRIRMPERKSLESWWFMMLHPLPSLAVKALAFQNRKIWRQVLVLRHRIELPNGNHSFWPIASMPQVTIENVGFLVREPMLAQGKVHAITGFSFSSINLKSKGQSQRYFIDADDRERIGPLWKQRDRQLCPEKSGSGQSLPVCSDVKSAMWSLILQQRSNTWSNTTMLHVNPLSMKGLKWPWRHRYKLCLQKRNRRDRPCPFPTRHQAAWPILHFHTKRDCGWGIHRRISSYQSQPDDQLKLGFSSWTPLSRSVSPWAMMKQEPPFKISRFLWKGEFSAVVGPSGCGKSSNETGNRSPVSTGRSSQGRWLRSIPPQNRRDGFQNRWCPGEKPWKTSCFPWKSHLTWTSPKRKKHTINWGIAQNGRAGMRRPVSLATFRRHAATCLLCRALIHEPKLLMLDEPFAALDSFTREELWCVNMTFGNRKNSRSSSSPMISPRLFFSRPNFCHELKARRNLVERKIDLPRPRELIASLRIHFHCSWTPISEARAWINW